MRTGTENQMKLVLIRHGETASNKERRYLGRTEESLSAEGAEQLEKNKALKRYPAVDLLFSSPMKRCVETAAILYPTVRPVTVSQWREIDFGVFEGKNYEELKQDIRYIRWMDSNGTLPFPEGESREAFLTRCEEGFEVMINYLGEAEKKAGKKPETVGIIVHGGTIMALLGRFCGGYFEYQVPNGNGYVCGLRKCGGRLLPENPQRLF